MLLGQIFGALAPNAQYKLLLPGISAFLRRCGCQLKELTIRDDDKFQDEAVELLKCTPNLEQLSIEGNILLEPFFSKLIEVRTEITGTSQIILGKLRLSLCCATDNLAP